MQSSAAAQLAVDVSPNNKTEMQGSPHLVGGHLMHKGDLLLALQSWHLHRKQKASVGSALLL